MSEAPLPTAGPASSSLDDAGLARLYRALLVPRLVEEKMLRLLRQGRLSKWFSGIGQEAIAVGVVAAPDEADFVLPLHRNLGVFTARNVDLDRLLRQLLGREGGFTDGRDRSFHFGALEHGIVGMISHLGAMLPVADGLALAGRLRGERRVVAVFSGDGGASEGDFHEALNLAAVWRLPVVFVVENNGWGLSTPTSEQYACGDLADRAVGYGMPGVVIDGNDVLAVLAAVGAAADRGRGGDGPTLIEAKTYRMRGHEETSGTGYVPPDELARWARLDPLLRFESVLDGRGVLPAGEREALRVEIAAEVDARVEAALAAPEPDSTVDREMAAVWAPAAIASTPAGDRRARPVPGGPVVEMRYIDAISDGLREAMRADDRVVLLGQDIAEYGGAFKVTDGFVAEFGKERVRNTPIIESGALGCALGLALDGFHPMVEMQFGDFISCGFNQVVNNLATTHYRWGAPVPVVIRAPVGGGTGAGPFHSQNIEAFFANVPGLRIVAPATPADAKGLLLAAFEDPNPVLFLEHKALYRAERGPVPAGWHPVAFGEARVARPGRDATVVTYGIGVRWALEAAGVLADGGAGDVEVIDLRTLRPWDTATVLASVERTGRALVLHEAPQTGGFGGEIAAVIGERAFAHLDAPVVRVGSTDTPVPFSRRLEALHSARGGLLPALRSLLAY
ncbi:MAG TPA: dehydrogenase E1 component subunit alpha/beta [Acidimicrobiia bacterium]|nr:dehydrogenase E1 component subunit alpha/beta [Acidimicrobiia bacterium]